MRLTDLMEHQDLRTAIEEMFEPPSARAHPSKGPNAIKVHGYIVQGHWRRRTMPQRHRLRLVKRK